MAAGDLEQTVGVSEGGEIGVLAESLETMRSQLKESLETIRGWGEELEATVADRTAELSMRNRQLAAVTAVATAAYQARDVDGVIRSCLGAILEHGEFDGAAVRIADADEGGLGDAVSTGTYGGFPCHKLSTWPGECSCGVVFGDASELQPDVPASFDVPCPRGTVAVLPLRTRKGVLGVLCVTRAHEEPVRPDERSALAAIADQLAIAIENAQLVEEIAAIEAQREVQRIKAELISSVSHELRTPLGFVKSYATTLLRDDAGIDPETRRQFLEVIDEETGKLGRMIEELLDVSRLQAGRLPVELQPVMVGALVDDAVAKMRPTLAETGHDVVLRLPSPDVEILADPLRVEQILDNLLQNAARYSEPGTQVEADVLSDGEFGLIAVRDHGDGVPEEDRERIFESFYRGTSARDRRSRGIGLGLAICRGLVEAQHGTIWVESALGGGAVFIVSLPLAPNDASTAASPATAPSTPIPAAHQSESDASPLHLRAGVRKSSSP
jgi:signal transduction histidine kinase